MTATGSRDSVLSPEHSARVAVHLVEAPLRATRLRWRERRAIRAVLGADVRPSEVCLVRHDRRRVVCFRAGTRRWLLKTVRDAARARAEQASLEAVGRLDGVRVPAAAGAHGRRGIQEFVAGVPLLSLWKKYGEGQLVAAEMTALTASCLRSLARIHAGGHAVAPLHGLPGPRSRERFEVGLRRQLRRLEERGIARYRRVTGSAPEAWQAALDPARIDSMVERVTAEPDRDLVHGDANPRNVLVSGTEQPVWIDWEGLARGPGLADVANLLARTPSEMQDDLVSAYLDERRRCGAPLDECELDARIRSFVMLFRLVYAARSVKNVVRGQPEVFAATMEALAGPSR